MVTGLVKHSKFRNDKNLKSAMVHGSD
jgi:hypothetical protein